MTSRQIASVFSSCTVFFSVPTSGTCISNMSPALSHFRSSAFWLSLVGVPVAMMSPGFERHEGRDIRQDVDEAEDHVIGGVVLRHLAVDLAGDVQRLGQIDVGRHPRADAAGRIPCLALGDVEAAVADPVADGALVAHGDAGDILQRAVLRECAGRSCRSPAQISPSYSSCSDSGGRRIGWLCADQRVRRLEEHARILGLGVAAGRGQFGVAVGVVHADAENFFAADDRRQQLHLGQRKIGPDAGA